MFFYKQLSMVTLSISLNLKDFLKKIPTVSPSENRLFFDIKTVKSDRIGEIRTMGFFMLK